jgi:CheY-like chemotaxis protein
MPKKILIVEDNRNMQDIYTIYFESRKGEFEVEMQGSAEIALEKTKTDTYDLIILDIIMEPMTGESFLVYIRENPKTKDIPVLIVSVLSPDMLVQLKKYPKVEFMQKPIPEEKLIAALNRMLS